MPLWSPDYRHSVGQGALHPIGACLHWGSLTSDPNWPTAPSNGDGFELWTTQSRVGGLDWLCSHCGEPMVLRTVVI